ncbi:hypothetical protein ACFSJY_18725 [Thalassotalea euphylliae]|uniref:hypothetical protein n=1 Tax=Thalassotalea euphylliae TaxID=1655234 RepID=UPI003624D6DC
MLLVLASTIATLIVGAGNATQSYSFIVALEVVGFIISLILFTYLAYKQIKQPYKHAFYVAILYWLISLSMGLLMEIFLNVPVVPLAFLFPFLLNVIAVLLGTLGGIQLRQKLSTRIKAI